MRTCWMVSLGLALLLFGPLEGCEKGDKATRQKKAVEAKRAAVAQEIDGVLKKWLDQMVSSLPEDVKKYPKAKSPLVRWRLDSFSFDWRRPMGAAVVKAKGTPFEKDFQAILEFFDAMERFWKKEIDFKDYMQAWDKVKAGNHSKMVNLLADFDHTFVHVEAFYGAQDMEGDDRAIYFFRHWQVAFHFPREYSESVSQYLERLCKAKLKDFCLSAPFEKLHFAMEKPYLTEVKRIVSEYLANYPDCKLNRIFGPFVAEVDARLASLKPIEEDPPLPESISRKDFVGQVILTVRKTGLEYEGKTLLTFKGDSWQLPSQAELARAQAEATKLSNSLEKEQGPENMEVIRLDADKGAPMAIAAFVASTWSKLPARFLTFGARRRLDGINKGTVTGSLQIRDVPFGKRNRDIGGRVYQCQDLGQSVEKPDLKPQVAVFVTEKAVMVGQLNNDKVASLTQIEPREAATRLLAGPGLLLVGAEVPVERFIAVLDPLFFKCRDTPACSVVDDQSPQVRVEVCSAR